MSDLTKKLIEVDIIVKKREMPTSDYDLSIYRKYRTSLYVKADTLDAIISATRATLSQRIEKPFTGKDMKLREIILKEYPYNASSFFPWGFNMEPYFTIA